MFLELRRRKDHRLSRRQILASTVVIWLPHDRRRRVILFHGVIVRQTPALIDAGVLDWNSEDSCERFAFAASAMPGTPAFDR